MTLESFLTYLLIVIWAHNCTEKVSKGFFFLKRIHIFLNLTCFASIRQIKLLRQFACICCRSDWIRAFHWITSQLHQFLCCFHLYSTWLRGFLRSVYYMYFVFQFIRERRGRLFRLLFCFFFYVVWFLVFSSPSYDLLITRNINM